jgi:hypothetical protein
MNTYEVVEFYYDMNDGDAPTVLATFTDEATAQVFAERHYETQTSTRQAEPCKCAECAEGWKVHEQNRGTYSVEVWEANQ